MRPENFYFHKVDLEPDKAKREVIRELEVTRTESTRTSGKS